MKTKTFFFLNAARTNDIVANLGCDKWSQLYGALRLVLLHLHKLVEHGCSIVGWLRAARNNTR